MRRISGMWRRLEDIESRIVPENSESNLRVEEMPMELLEKLASVEVAADGSVDLSDWDKLDLEYLETFR